MVIAGDISNTMLELLITRASENHVPLDRIIPCRLNALSIPLANESMEAVTANAVLHLISEPIAVMREIARVLKPGGKLVLVGNSPGLPKKASDELEALNRDYLKRVNQFYKQYWQLMQERGVKPAKYSWKFDQHAACEELFGNHTRINIAFFERREITMSDGFLYRMEGKGFSDQQGVPDALHKEVFTQVMGDFKETYGPDFDTVTCVSITDGLVLHVFEKTEALHEAAQGEWAI